MDPTKTRVALRAIAGFGIAFLIGALLAAVVAIAQIRSTQLEGTPVGKRLLASSDRILDCTDASGECFKRNQRRTADAVGDIGRYIVFAAACSATVDTAMPVDERIAEITDCVTDRLAR